MLIPTVLAIFAAAPQPFEVHRVEVESWESKSELRAYDGSGDIAASVILSIDDAGLRLKKPISAMRCMPLGSRDRARH